VIKNPKPGLMIWRIEQFKVVSWPKEMYGKFYSGDSYIILKTYQNPGSQELLYDVHFWIGMHSSQDEYGTAAYKTVELDTLLDDKPIQHREVEGYESSLFKSYFPSLTYMKGGCPSGFRHVETKEYQPRLFHVSGDRAKTVTVKEVKMSKDCLDSGDVFIMDLGGKVYQWNGSKSSKDERFRAAQYLRQLSDERHGKIKTEVVDEDGLERSHEFLEKLSDEKSQNKFRQHLDSSHAKTLYKLSDENGALEFSKEAEGQFQEEHLNEEDVWIIDNGQTIYVYVGEHASTSEKKNALVYAHNYLKETTYPHLPVTVVHKQAQGPSYDAFKKTIAAA
jgi:gelsolin